MWTIGNVLKQNCQWPVGRGGLPYLTSYLSSSGYKFGSSHVVQQLHIHYMYGRTKWTISSYCWLSKTKIPSWPLPSCICIQNILLSYRLAFTGSHNGEWIFLCCLVMWLTCGGNLLTPDNINVTILWYYEVWWKSKPKRSFQYCNIVNTILLWLLLDSYIA